MRIVLVLAGCLFLSGCQSQSVPTAGPPASSLDAAAPAANPADAASAPSQESDALELTPANTRIEFVGTHVGEPNPRKGDFEKFSGKLQFDAAAKQLKSVNLQIEAASVRTEIPRLTNHLKSADFFEVNEFPTIAFESTNISGGEGECQITGKLTLHGETKEIIVPATVQFGPQGVSLQSAFSIQRSEFGMNYGPNRVEDKVSLAVSVGEQTQPQP
jgi:polyisoprenoid-binding protein YceI